MMDVTFVQRPSWSVVLALTFYKILTVTLRVNLELH